MPTKIDWCDETINPLGHGCYGTGTKEKPEICHYCYAAKLAKRNMRGCELCRKFIPHTHFEQLKKLQQWKNGKTIFIQSMGDLFGEWVPDEWIERVFEACEKAPQHRYLFLTKNPKRYEGLYKKNVFPDNGLWFGSTITTPKDFYWRNLTRNCFLSVEPLQAEFKNFVDWYGISWVIIGAETGNRKGKVITKREWIENIVEECRRQCVPVFMKDSLAGVWGGPLIREYPWREGSDA